MFGHFQLVFERLRKGENPRMVPINNLQLWVQLYGMNTGFMSQRVITYLWNYIGKYYLEKERHRYANNKDEEM